ncbi:MAG: hypothetical protein H6582_00960 [Crocinitomicaceae bacterium]|nr:hypothetical protein [Crocinitomicaceae bacterium]
MQQVIIDQAKEFFEWKLFGGSKRNTLERTRDKLSSELYNFYEDRNKLLFLKTLKPLIVEAKTDHEKTCTTKNCGTSEEYRNALFCIDQEITSIENSYSYSEQYNSEKSFTPEEESELIQRLSNLEELLVKQGLGQEIIFDEINELKDHFNIGKKNWFQFLKGKLFDLGTEKVLEKTVITTAWTMLKEGFDEAAKLLE